MQIRTVIFDLDGTLVDTEKAATLAITSTFRSWGLQIEAGDSQYITGRTWATALNYLCAKYTLPVSPQEAEVIMLKTYREGLIANLEIVPGSVEAVRALAESYPLALVSGSSRQEIFYCLDRLQIRESFQFILGCEDYPQSKPAPDGYLKAMGMLGVTGGQTLIFEDSTAGIASGRAAGAWVVAIGSTNHFGQDTSRAHFSIEDLTGVNPAWINARTWSV
jgi:HAD superfamily hydrolase (TIGR01509 family)